MQTKLRGNLAGTQHFHPTSFSQGGHLLTEPLQLIPRPLFSPTSLEWLPASSLLFTVLSVVGWQEELSAQKINGLDPKVPAPTLINDSPSLASVSPFVLLPPS